MAGRQINFYLMPEDLSLLNGYIKKTGLLIMANNPNKQHLELLNSVRKVTKGFKFLIHPKDCANFRTSRAKSPDYFKENEESAPTVKLWASKIDRKTKSLSKGLIYYTPDYYNSEGKLVEKNQQFIEAAEQLFSWIRKTYKKAPSRKKHSFIITQKVVDWMETEGGTLEK